MQMHRSTTILLLVLSALESASALHGARSLLHRTDQDKAALQRTNAVAMLTAQLQAPASKDRDARSALVALETAITVCEPMQGGPTADAMRVLARPPKQTVVKTRFVGIVPLLSSDAKFSPNAQDFFKSGPHAVVGIDTREPYIYLRVKSKYSPSDLGKIVIAVNKAMTKWSSNHFNDLKIYRPIGRKRP